MRQNLRESPKKKTKQGNTYKLNFMELNSAIILHLENNVHLPRVLFAKVFNTDHIYYNFEIEYFLKRLFQH